MSVIIPARPGDRESERSVTHPAKDTSLLEGLGSTDSWPSDSVRQARACGVWTHGLANHVFLSIAPLGAILRAPDEGGDSLRLLESGHAAATGLGRTGGMISHPVTERLYTTQPDRGSIVAVEPFDNRDYHFSVPAVMGLPMPTCVRFSPDGATMFACSPTNGTLWHIANFERWMATIETVT